MTATEYIEKNKDAFHITFIIAHSVKGSGSPFYNTEYKTTPIYSPRELLRDYTWYKDYIVVNADHPPICIPGFWVRDYNAGHLKCCIIEKPEDIRLTCGGEKQFRDMLDWYGRTVK